MLMLRLKLELVKNASKELFEDLGAVGGRCLGQHALEDLSGEGRDSTPDGDTNAPCIIRFRC